MENKNKKISEFTEEQEQKRKARRKDLDLGVIISYGDEEGGGTMSFYSVKEINDSPELQELYKKQTGQEWKVF